MPISSSALAESCIAPHIDYVQPLDGHDLDCLEEVKGVLERHGKRDRFGIRLVYRDFDLADGEVMVERTDVGKRVQTLRPEQLERVRDNTLETSWILRDGDREAMAFCDTRCWKDVHGNHQSQHV